jgi:hypothetical protein
MVSCRSHYSGGFPARRRPFYGTRATQAMTVVEAWWCRRTRKVSSLKHQTLRWSMRA